MPAPTLRRVDRLTPRPLRGARSAVFALIACVCALLLAEPVAAQSGSRGGGGGFGGGSPASPPPGGSSTRPQRVTRGLSEFATDEVVAEIRIRGNETVPTSRITGQMQTRVGRPFDPRALAADIRTLTELQYFVAVRPLHRSTPAGRVIVLEVVERRTLRYVDYLGNEKIKDKKLAEQTGLAVGGAIDPYAVTEGRRKIEAHYREKGYGRVYVEIVEGDKPSDQGVVYSINEGSQEKIWEVSFEGNSFVADGRLKTKIRSKPSPVKYLGSFIGGKLNRETLDQDVAALTSFYRSFGFFRARVGRSVELNEEGDWATIRFAINEGPRYSVRNVTINGAEKLDSASMREVLKMTANQPFEQAILETDLTTLRDVYGSRGYVFADVQAETIFLEEPGMIDLVYNIEEGEQWRVGKINVSINGEASHTRIQTALNAIGLRPGDILDTQKVRADERRLGARGIFNTNPAQGSTPKITYRPSEETNRRFAEREQQKEKARRGVFRGQSPSPHTTFKPQVVGFVYRLDRGELVVTERLNSSAYRPAWQTQQDVVRGQGPIPHTAFKPPFESSVYGVQPPPAQGTPPQAALAYNGAGQAAAPVASGYPASGYGGSTPRAIDPASAPIVPARSHPVTPVQYTQPVQSLAAPTYGQSPQPAFAPPSGGQVTPAFAAAPAPAAVYGEPAPQGFVQQASQVPPGGGVVPVQFGSLAPPESVNTGVFPPVGYQPALAPPPNDPITPYADLNISLQETQTGRFTVGAAVNSDAGLVGQISLDERNFDWRRIPRSWRDWADGSAFRGGGQRFRLEAAPGTQVQRYLASWQDPYFLDSPISLNLSASFFDRRFDDWDEQRTGGRIGLGYQWVDRDLSGSLTYRGENVNIHDVADPTLPEYAEVLGDNSLHGFGVRLINDKRNNPFLATDGYYLGLTLEQVFGTFTYSRAEIDARTYMLLRERPDHTGRHVVSFSTRTGFTGSNTPVYDRFFAGGFSTLRGFDFRGASPNVNGLEVGGDFLFINSLEYLFPITADDSVNGVVFVDHGTVNENVSLDNYRVAPGVGLRVTVPALGPAPIALDFAWPISDVFGDDERVFTFNVGLQR